MRQAHAQDGVARLQQRQIHRLVGLGTAVRLDVRVIGAKHLLDAVDRQLFGNVDELAAAVVALARIAFGVFVGQLAALRFHHQRAAIVFAGDQLDMILLAAGFSSDGLGQFGVVGFQSDIAREHSKLRGSYCQ